MWRYGCQVIREQTSSNFLLKRTVSQNPSGRPSCDPFHFKARLMSAIGTKRTLACALQMSAIGGKADMPFCTAYVRL